MSKIVALKSKYGHFDATGLNHEQKRDLRDSLKSFEVGDLNGVEEHIAYLELINLFRSSLIIDANLNGENYLALLESLLSVDVYSSPLRFLFELIQNVDDCDYDDPSCAELDIKTDFNNGKIILTYNEVGFSPYNVFAITGIAEAAKNISADKIEIGEKGIGFKSAFGVANKVLIQSGKFSFELYKNNFTIPQPSYEEYEEVQGTRLTLFVEPIIVKQIYDAFVNKYKERQAILNQNPVLFLNKLTRLRVYFDDLRTLSFSVERRAPTQTEDLTVETDVHLTVDLCDTHGQADKPMHQELICTRYSKAIVYDRDMCISRYGEKTTFPQKRMYMHVVFPDPVSLYDNTIKTGAFYSFLPTIIKLTVPMACHVPFKLDPPREYIDPDKQNQWFQHSCKEFAKMLEEVYVDYARRVQEDIVSYVPNRTQYLFEADAEKINCLKQSTFKGESILKLPIFRSVKGNFLPAEQVFVFPTSENVSDPEKVWSLLGESRELFLPGEHFKNKNPGISTVLDVNTKLFNRAMLGIADTDAILDVLSGIESFSFEKRMSSLGKKNFGVEQIKVFSKHEKCLSALNNHAAEQVKKNLLPFFHADLLSSDMQDVRFIEGGESGLDASDFNRNAARYFKKQGYKCFYLPIDKENFFFACDNVLFLSDQHRETSLSAFCELIDQNCTLAMNLRFKNASNRLNTASEDMDPRDYLTLLRGTRKAIQAALGPVAYSRYVALINDAGMDPERYVNELLQNADDCIYADGVKPSFVLSVAEDLRRIATRYNEIGFTRENVRAITSIGESTKKKLLASDGQMTEIGEKGVGFKAIFAVAKRVFVRSGPFHFMLTDKAPTIPALPSDEGEPVQGTQMMFELKESMKKYFFTEEKVLRLCVCLRKLKSIRLGDYRVRITDDENVRRIEVNDKVYEYQILTHSFEVTDESIIAERENQQRRIDKKQKIVCYVHPGKEASNCYLYAGLPTQVRIKVPMIIDAPFELTTSRDHVMNNRWNDCIINQVYSAIQMVIKTLAKTEGIDVLRFLHIKREGTAYFTDIFSEDRLNKYDLLSKLRIPAFLQTYHPTALANPFDARAVRVPDLLAYCLNRGQDIGVPVNVIVKAKEKQYEAELNALGVKVMNVRSVVNALKQVCEDNIQDEEFRELLYSYLSDHSDELDEEQNTLRRFKIIPVYTEQKDDVRFVSWNECNGRLYVKSKGTLSSSNCYILVTDLMKKTVCESILDETVSELTGQIELANYREELTEKLQTMKPAPLYAYLLKEYRLNWQMLDGCRNDLFASIHMIPLKNELGEIKCGRVYVSDQPEGYYVGEILRAHIVSKECEAFARFIRCKNIFDIHYDDLDLNIGTQLTDKDVESFLDDHIRNGFEILTRCLREGQLSQKLAEEYDIITSDPTRTEYDDSVLNQPVNAQRFAEHMRRILGNRIRIEKREERQFVSYGVPEKNTEQAFRIDNEDVRFRALQRYETRPRSGYCVCQMCKDAKAFKYMEVNTVLRKPKYFWPECGVALCLICSKRFEELRNNDNVRDRFHKEILKADPYVDHPISVRVLDDCEIVFAQTHLAEIQGILKYGDE